MANSARRRTLRPEPMLDRLVDVHEAANMLGLSPATMYDWAYKRRLPVVKLSGPRGPLRFRVSALQEIIRRAEQPALKQSPLDRD